MPAWPASQTLFFFQGPRPASPVRAWMAPEARGTTSTTRWKHSTKSIVSVAICPTRTYPHKTGPRNSAAPSLPIDLLKKIPPGCELRPAITSSPRYSLRPESQRAPASGDVVAVAAVPLALVVPNEAHRHLWSVIILILFIQRVEH